MPIEKSQSLAVVCVCVCVCVCVHADLWGCPVCHNHSAAQHSLPVSIGEVAKHTFRWPIDERRACMSLFGSGDALTAAWNLLVSRPSDWACMHTHAHTSNRTRIRPSTHTHTPTHTGENHRRSNFNRKGPGGIIKHHYRSSTCSNNNIIIII